MLDDDASANVLL